MMDVRLDAGRHHLDSAEAAGGTGDWSLARDHFESALLQFRGPDLLLGEGHARRGLATVDLGEGDPVAAERNLRAAIRAYREVRALLDRVDELGQGVLHRTDAMEGEAVAQVLLGGLLLRTGRVAEAREARDWASAAFDGLGDRPTEAGLWALTGRLAARDGELEAAKSGYETALSMYEHHGDRPGQAATLRALAEVHRLAGSFDAAHKALRDALLLCRDHPRLEAQVLVGLGSLARQRGDDEEALRSFEQVLALSGPMADDEMVGYAYLNLGELVSRDDEVRALSHFREAVRLLGGLGIHHGVGAAMHCVASHAIARRQFIVGLAAAESARRTWRGMDPVRGVGQAMRLQVKAFAGCRQWRSVLTVAEVRARLAGSVQPHAIEVRDFYAQRAPVEWRDAVLNEEPVALMAAFESQVVAAIEPLFTQLGLPLDELGSVDAGLSLIDLLAQSGEVGGDLPELDADALEPAPEEEVEMYVLTDDLGGRLVTPSLPPHE